MRTKLILPILLSMFVTSGAFAQLQVLQGSSRNFWVNKTNGVTLDATTPYTWTITGAGIVTITPNDSTASATFSNVAGTNGRIDVFATSSGGCNSDTSSIQIQVVASLTFNATFATPSQNICPFNNHGSTGDAAAVTVNFTGGNVASFTYTLDGTSNAVSVIPAGISYSLDVTTAYTAAQSGAHLIRITSITGQSGVTSLIPAGSEPTYTINVGNAATISNIKF
jgi:hypothetical protein